MIGMPGRRAALAAALGAAAIPALAPPTASSFTLRRPGCNATGPLNGPGGKACSPTPSPGHVGSAATDLLTAHLGGSPTTLLSDGASAVVAKVTTHLALAAVVTWVIGGAEFALEQTAQVIGRTTSPQLGSLWFSSTYWRVAAIAALLTLPFLFAAAVQAVIVSDLALLLRAALGYLPLAGLAVAIAAPLTMLLLAASDQLSAIVGSAAGQAGTHFFASAGGALAAVSLEEQSPFLIFFVAVLTVGGAILLWLELLMRAAAVYVIVLMLPLGFAAMVWPARRVWAIRAVELLVALILSKFAIVAVLSLGGAAIGESAGQSVTGLIAGVTLLALAICAPWALLRLLPMAELAGGAIGTLRGEAKATAAHLRRAQDHAGGATAGLAMARSGDAPADWASTTTAQMRRDHEATVAGAPDESSRPERQPSPGPEPPATPEALGAPVAGSEPAGPGRAAIPEAPTVGAPETSVSSDEPATDSGPSPRPTAAPRQPPTASSPPDPPRPWEAEDMTLEPLVLGPDAEWLEGLRQPEADDSNESP